MLVLTWDQFEAKVWEATRNYAEGAGISTKDGLNKYLRRAQTGTATKQSAAGLVLLDTTQLLQSVSMKKKVQSTENCSTCFEIKEGVH